MDLAIYNYNEKNLFHALR